MDQYFTEEDSVIKTRKPYTITKQRERWTDEEHSRFLEALKLYGRAWQRIEEHIGTKTAVQIRSHAQKFFTKLEKDALVKGVPIVQALDIDIPPPRPKRKPSNPYPRKTFAGSPISQVGVRDERPSQNKQILDLEKEQHHEKATDEEQTKNDKENHSNKALEVGNLLQEACSSISSINKSFFPPVASKKEVISQGSESHISSESRTMAPKYGDAKQLFQHDDIGKASKFQNSKASLEQLNKGERHFLPTNEMQSTGGSLCISAQTSLPEIHLEDPRCHTKEGVQGRNNLFANTAASSPYENQINHHRSIFQSFPDFRTPFTPICHNQDYHTSSTFSNLTSSTLWPYKNAGTSAESSVYNQEAFSLMQLEAFSLMQLNSCPGIAAMAAATVAAATAWWAAHGQLAPFHAAFTCPPGVGNPVPDTMAEGRLELSQRCPSQDLQVNPEQSEVLQAECSASKLLLITESKEMQDANVNDLKECTDHEKGHDWNMEKRRKRISNGQVEIDAVEKNKKGEKDQDELEANAPATESGSRRSKCTSNSVDSWKEVSQESRLAFQALFSRGILPQSFSPQQDRKDENQETNTNKKHIDSVNDDVHLSLTLKGGYCRNDQSSGTITIGVGPGKISHRRTGFKPYKRCSVESSENRGGASSCYGEDKGAKRKRLEKASS